MKNHHSADASIDEGSLLLPLDFYRTPGAEARLGSHAFALDVPELRGGGGAEGGPDGSEALLAAVFGILLFRYNGQPSIPFKASRMGPSGQVRWALPISLRVAADATCRGVLEQAGALLQGLDQPPASRGQGEAQQACGTAGAQGSQASTGEPAGSSAALTWLEADGDAVEGELDARCVLEGSPLASRSADLHLVLARAGARHRATFVYNTSLFKPATIERFAGHLGVLLASAAADRDAALSRLPLLPLAEQAWLDTVCEGRPRSLPPWQAHELFERHAAATPDAVALRFRDEQMSYGALNRRANQLARCLVARGIGAEDRVVVCVEPAFDILVALLGVLKAGAVYVPIDPGYPPARVGAILDDTRPALVLTQERLLERLAPHGAAMLALDTADEELGAFADGDPGTEIAPGQTAYIYYTSGTTGKPKGAMASHANLLAYLQVAQDRYGIDRRDVMPAIARFSFSISMFELMSPLVAGGSLLLLDREHVLDPARMSRTLGEVTFFHAGPSLLKILIAHIRREYRDFSAFAGVRHASSGGDMIAPEVLEALKEIFSRAEVFVIYGCSEISCMGCTYAVPRDRPATTTYVGRPFDGMTVKVLDAAMNVLPAGVVGEIHFAGSGVVKGYLNRPELTAERFVELGGRRFYRTGDVGRLSEDGWLEILGRSDFQVKLRGMRVELGEVEHHLRRAPGVRDGVVVARAGAGGEKALVAYVVTAPADGSGDEEGRLERLSAVRRYMTERVPDYMVPSTYVELASLPLNHNMKVDRRALPGAERPGQGEGAAARGRAPETAMERDLASRWARLLGVETVGLDDNFFELGGHSMLAMELIAELERDVGVGLDGMDVLRESLEVQGALCDGRLGRAPKPRRARTVGADAGRSIEVFQFGHDRGLYGVLHLVPPGSTEGWPRRAALICAPVGAESVRAGFVLQRLASQLAALGVPTMRFDYFGCGDSLGEGKSATLGRWQRDVAEALVELKRRTGAAEIAAVGVRLGAPLLCRAARSQQVDRLVLWDPVCDGAAHHASLRELHRRYLRSVRQLRLGRRAPVIEGGEELLGSVYSSEALRELDDLVLTLATLTRHDGVSPLRWLMTSHPTAQRARFSSICGQPRGSRFEELGLDAAWDDLSKLEDVLPDVGVTRALTAMVMEER
jgi:amino acid adenylation domain-containing protein